MRYLAGKVQTMKVRLVAIGYTQMVGVDYEETFSHVAMLKSIKILLSIAIFYAYEICLTPEGSKPRSEEKSLQAKLIHLWVETSIMILKH